jgi:hypothetical protein
MPSHHIKRVHAINNTLSLMMLTLITWLTVYQVSPAHPLSTLCSLERSHYVKPKVVKRKRARVLPKIPSGTCQSLQAITGCLISLLHIH